MKVALGSDHTAIALKQELKSLLDELGMDSVDVGVNGCPTSSDYPVWGDAAAQLVASGQCDLGIVLCGTGIGISLAANKVHGIRCAVVSEPYSAQMARAHNNANMLAMGARVVGSELAKMIAKTFLETPFEGGRHQRRVNQVMSIENGQPIQETVDPGMCG